MPPNSKLIKQKKSRLKKARLIGISQRIPFNSQYKLFKKYDGFGEKEYIELAKYCSELEIDFLSTPFDLEAVEFLNPLMKLFKVASADITNVPLLRSVASKGKPVLLSTGSSRVDEIQTAVDILKNAGAQEIVLLHCILNYPTEDKNGNLFMIKDLAKHFPDITLGYSDHTLPDKAMTALSMSWLLGAKVIEKHFTHDKTLPGNDHYHAMDKADLLVFREQIEKIEALAGSSLKSPLRTEVISRRNARRSLVTNGPIKKGEVFSEAKLFVSDLPLVFRHCITIKLLVLKRSRIFKMTTSFSGMKSQICQQKRWWLLFRPEWGLVDFRERC